MIVTGNVYPEVENFSKIIRIEPALVFRNLATPFQKVTAESGSRPAPKSNRGSTFGDSPTMATLTLS